MMDGGLKPPFPMWDRLLVDDIWGKYLITDSPWLHMQVSYECNLKLFLQTDEP